MLLRRLPSILPHLTSNDAISSYKIHNLVKHKFNKDILSPTPPFRSPHHTISYAGMIGGGKTPLPGEISLAHLGILFLDELPEFPRTVLEVLRQPLEDKQVTISRANFSITYPCQFMLVAAMNPCPCGYYLDPLKKCQCQPTQITKYWKKISGPILDRIDIILDVPRVKEKEFTTPSTSPSSTQIKDHITTIRKTQINRQKDTLNAHLSPKEIQKWCKLTKDSQDMLNNALSKGYLTGRSYHKVLKLSRTIADYEDKSNIELPHIMEALQYRKNCYLAQLQE